MKKLGIDSLAKQALETNKNGKIFTKDTNEYIYTNISLVLGLNWEKFV